MNVWIRYGQIVWTETNNWRMSVLDDFCIIWMVLK